MQTKTRMNQATQALVPTMARLTDTTMRDRIICTAKKRDQGRMGGTATLARPRHPSHGSCRGVLRLGPGGRAGHA